MQSQQLSTGSQRRKPPAPAARPAKLCGGASSQLLRVSELEPQASEGLRVQLAQGSEGVTLPPQDTVPRCRRLWAMLSGRVPGPHQHLPIMEPWRNQRHPHSLSQRGEPASPPTPPACF